ncbi:hypothetical protein [Paenibacillus wenxiniae]|uniref:hypothetical protein n=1 Tax=Paenibacillus wenxiniae TaxID=1636843 RepID=UPI003A929023
MLTVALCARAWIKTSEWINSVSGVASLSVRELGLKQLGQYEAHDIICRSLCESVD